MGDCQINQIFFIKSFEKINCVGYFDIALFEVHFTIEKYQA